MFRNMQKSPLNSIHAIRSFATYHSKYGSPIMGSIKNYYDVLKVKPNSTGRDIKRAYIELSKKYHPDGNSHTSDPDEFVKVCEAYKILYKRVTRQHYDSRLRSQFYMVQPVDMNYTSHNVHKTWKQYQATMRCKQFGYDIPSSKGSTIVYRKPLEIKARSIAPVLTVEPPASFTLLENKFKALLTKFFRSRPPQPDWKLASFMMGFFMVWILLVASQLRRRQRKSSSTL